MVANLVQVNYEHLEEVIGMFDSCREQSETALKRLESAFDALVVSEWLGQSAEAFSSEMEYVVFPRIKNLIDGLEASGTTVANIIETMWEAEDRAGRLFSEAGLSGAFFDGIRQGFLQTENVTSTNGVPLGSWSEWLKHGAKAVKLDELLQSKFFRSDLAPWINRYLLETDPALKQKWMKFLRTNGVSEIAGGVIDGLLADNLSDGLLEFGGGIAKAGLSYFGKDLLGATGVGSLGYVIDGTVEMIQEGDPSKLISGGLKAGVYLIPGGKAVMIGNSAIQFIGGGVGTLVHAGSDWLSNGDSALAEGFRDQADSFQSHLKDMDLNGVFDSTAQGITEIFNGDTDAGFNTLGQGIGTFGDGLVNTAFEGSKLFWTTTGSIFEKVTGVDTSGFVSEMQDFTLDEAVSTAGFLLNEGGEIIQQVSTSVSDAIHNVHNDVQHLTNLVGDFLDRSLF